MLTDEHLAIFHRFLFWALLVPSKKGGKKSEGERKGSINCTLHLALQR